MTEARLGDAGITDTSMKYLAPLTGLRSLLLGRSAIRGPGLKHLAGMRELAYLDLSGTHLTDDGLRALPGTPDVKAAAPFYGPQPANYAELARTKAAVSAVYAELDTRITSSTQQMEQELRKSGSPYRITVYPGVNHAFHNDTNADRYNAAAAQKAWVATVEWFRKYLV